MNAATYRVTFADGRPERTLLLHDDQLAALRRHPTVASVLQVSDKQRVNEHLRNTTGRTGYFPFANDFGKTHKNDGEDGHVWA